MGARGGEGTWASICLHVFSTDPVLCKMFCRQPTSLTVTVVNDRAKKIKRYTFFLRKTTASTELEMSLDLVGLVGHITFKTLKTIISKFSAKIKKVLKFSNWGRSD